MYRECRVMCAYSVRVRGCMCSCVPSALEHTMKGSITGCTFRPLLNLTINSYKNKKDDAEIVVFATLILDEMR